MITSGGLIAAMFYHPRNAVLMQFLIRGKIDVITEGVRRHISIDEPVGLK
jgi:hypothetical protein